MARNDDTSTTAGLKWRLRVSPRARHARLRILPFGGLEVVIPRRFPRSQVAGLVEQHADWARRQLARQARLRSEISLPTVLSLEFDGSCTPVRYAAAAPPLQGELFDAGDGERIDIRAGGQRAAIGELRRWIRRRAQRLLPPVLDRLAARTGLEYARVGIRSQKTRWGSCSSRGSISLNDQLLFLPPETVEYLMIHELCHTRHLDHSPAFWSLVQSHCPEYRRHEKLLGQPRGLVPDWFLLDLYD
jgi:predicted metal-dependent hydrolase